MVLGVRRPTGEYLGVPQRSTRLQPGDVVIAYGRLGSLDALDRRDRGWWGDREHAEAVAEQGRVVEDEQARDEALEAPAASSEAPGEAQKEVRS